MIKGLVPKSANLKCQSIAHNEKSPATLATIFLRGFRNGDNYKQGEVIIDKGVIVWTLATRCDGIPECFAGEDENGCGDNNPYSTTFIGILHY